MIAHVNSNQKKYHTDNYKIYNVLNENDGLIAYLLQVIFTRDSSFYTEYNNTKHPDYLVIDDGKLGTNDSLSLEFIVHDADTIVTENYLPFSKNRQYKTGFVFDGTNSEFTYSIFVSTIKDCCCKEIIVNINTLNDNCIYFIQHQN